MEVEMQLCCVGFHLFGSKMEKERLEQKIDEDR